MSDIEVFGLGALNIDHIYKVERILNDDETVANEAVSFPGGSAANTIYGLARLGVKTGFAGVVGDDAEGKILLQDFQKVGVYTGQIKIKPQAKTGSVLCLSDRFNKRSLYVSPGANSLLTMDDLNLAYINEARILHLASFADDKQFQLSIELMNRLESSIKLSFAPGALYAAKGLTALSPILARTHTLFINQDEIKRLTREDVTSGAESCLNQGCHIVAVTLGKGMKLELGKGANRRAVTTTSYVRDANNEYVIEPARRGIAPQVDVTGAGDAFATGFLYGLLKGKGLEECGRLGDITARFSITKLGAREGFPTINALAQRYRKLYSRQL